MKARPPRWLLAPALWAAALLSAFGSEPVEVKPAGQTVVVLVGGRPFTTYSFDPSIAKPFLWPLRSAQGTVVTRSFPMDAAVAGEDRDEPHQRALFFAHGRINGLDFWNEFAFAKWSGHARESAFGRTVFRQLDEARGGPDSGSLRAEFDLVDSTGALVGGETQAYVVLGGADTRIIDCEFTLRASHGPLTLGDEKDGTFGIRLVKALDSPPGRMVNSEGGVGEKQIWGQRADWVDYDGEVAGESLGVAVFDSPLNFRHPTTWHARAYGLLAANPFGLSFFTRDRSQDGSYTIPAGGALTLRYRVFIHHGDYRQAGVAAAYAEYEKASRP